MTPLQNEVGIDRFSFAPSSILFKESSPLFIKKGVRDAIMSNEEFAGMGEQAMGRTKEGGQPVPVKVITTPPEVARTSVVSMAVNTGGKIMGYGLGKVANLVAEFTSGFEMGMIAGRFPSERERQMRRQQAEEDMETIAIEG